MGRMAQKNVSNPSHREQLYDAGYRHGDSGDVLVLKGKAANDQWEPVFFA